MARFEKGKWTEAQARGAAKARIATDKRVAENGGGLQQYAIRLRAATKLRLRAVARKHIRKVLDELSWGRNPIYWLDGPCSVSLEAHDRIMAIKAQREAEGAGIDPQFAGKIVGQFKTGAFPAPPRDWKPL